jgi:hypothetical protein
LGWNLKNGVSEKIRLLRLTILFEEKKYSDLQKISQNAD